jgi:hypothetical protein
MYYPAVLAYACHLGMLSIMLITISRETWKAVSWNPVVVLHHLDWRNIRGDVNSIQIARLFWA